MKKSTKLHKIIFGILYFWGEGIGRNLEKSFYWYDKAAKNGCEVACKNLGLCYELGLGVSKDESKAFESYKKSAEIGDKVIKFHLGYCYVNGIGTIINKEKGLELYIEAAESTINDLFDNVFYWYQKLAENDNKLALYKLGEIYEYGNNINKSIIRAFYYYNQAAEKRCINGKYKIVELI